MRIVDIQIIGTEVAIKWDDGKESFLPFSTLRGLCPCAGCKGEMDIMGNVYKNPTKPLSDSAIRLVRIESVGGYAIRPIWADGHATGLFAFDYLRRCSETQT